MTINQKRINLNLSQRIKTLPYNPHLYKIYADGLVTVDELARIWDVAISTVYNMLEGRTRVSPERILKLFQAKPDPEILRYFTDGSGFMLIKRPDGKDPESTVLIQHLSVITSLGILSDNLKDALEDNQLDRREKEALIKDVEIIQKKLGEMHLILSRESNNKP